jgi:ATP-binding cassette subfamily F protein 3
MLYFENLSKSYAGKKVFENINGRVERGDRIGLIGGNGIGKSTLVKILSGEECTDMGKLEVSSSVKILYIEQYPKFSENVSVYEELYKSTFNNSSNIKSPDAVTQKALNTIGLTEKFWRIEARNLSGGEKTKLMLGKVLVSDFNLLILDEPTNHLDMESCKWLEEYLEQLNKTILVISHDRFFLDKVVNKIWELTADNLKVYKGNYSKYKIQKETEFKSQLKEYEKQQTRIENLERAIENRKNWYASAHKTAGQNDFYRSKAKKHTSVLKAKKRELEKLEKNKTEKPKKSKSPAFEVINKNIIDDKLPPILIRVENLTKSYGTRTVFKDVFFDIKRGDKIAVIGANGTGKTTLLKIINGLDQNYDGTVSISPSVKFGYFSQEISNLDLNDTILNNLLLTGATVNEVRLLLAGLLFKGDDVNKKVANLSMGERSRVAFAKLILSGANLLILDEPTNYMDIISREKVEDVLDEYQGSILFVSHDRYFIKRIANKILKIENQNIKYYGGDYRYYLDKIRNEALHDKLGKDYNQLSDQIRRLENELAFLSGKLAGDLDEDEKNIINSRFIEIARELNKKKQILKENR